MELTTAAIAGSLLPKLAQLFQDEDKLQKRVRGDVLFLTRNLEIIRAALQSMDEVPPEQLSVSYKIWGHQMKQFSYEVENVVDRILLVFNGSAAATPVEGSKLYIKKLVKFFHDIKNRREVSRKIKELMRRLDELMSRHERYKISSVRSGLSVMVDPRLCVLYKHQSQLVGIDAAVEDLARHLTTEDDMFREQQKIVCIVGFGGVGKTTLAREVFHKLQEHFECTAFVSLGQNPDMRSVSRMMLSQLTKAMDDIHETRGDGGREHYFQQSREFIHAKRYFVVVDDIWDPKAWDIIKNSAFMGSSNKSVVLVTTRSVDIAKNIGHIYRLSPLSKTYSRTLFYKTLFGSNNTCPPTMENIAEKFIAMCCGIPLAINACSRFLATMAPKDWHKLHDSFLSKESSPEIDGVRKILALSYTHLPPHLKSCLLYLSMFPKSFDITGERLVLGWIAEGFIDETEETTLQELGESYLCELINRSLIEAVMVDAGGKVLFCRVNTLMHGLITSLSLEQNFSATLNGDQSINLRGAMINRLSICGNGIEGKNSMSQVNLSHVRSFVAYCDANLMPSLSDFQQLRILDLGLCDDLQNDHLKGIDKSPLLKYVVIGGNSITRLPNEIVKLKLLHTLDLRSSSLNELPEIVVCLTQLKRLYVTSHMDIPDGIGKLKELEELGDINIKKPELLKDLSNLGNLRVLRIAMWSWNDNLVSSHEPAVGYLRSLGQVRQNIRSLSILTSCSLNFMDDLGAEWAPGLRNLEIMYSAFHTLPNWIYSLHNLSSLSVEVYKLSQQIIDMLGKFPTLYSLSLKVKHASEGNFIIANDGFSTLTGFHFASNAMGLIFAPGAMKRVIRLKLFFQASRTEDVCKGFNFGLQNLYSLEHVCVEINCFNASHVVVERAESAIREEISLGRSLEIRRVREEDMISEVVLEDLEQEQCKETKKNQRSSRRTTGVATKLFRQKRRKDLIETIRPFLIDSATSFPLVMKTVADLD